MVGLSSLFDIARSALVMSQQALAVTGHNVANVSTPGYSRQVAVLTERPPVNGQPGMVGTGVQATAIRRYVDESANRQLTVTQQHLGRYALMRDELSRLQNIFGDGNNQGVAAQLSEFFSGLQDVATSPGEMTARSVLLARATQLASSLNQVSVELGAARQSLNFQVRQTVGEINDLSAQIAELNSQIVSAEVTGQNANDLRDQRDVIVNELAKRVDITTIESSVGALSVFAARGQVLVEGGYVRQLVAVEDQENDGMLTVGYSTGGTRPLSIEGLVSSGRLRGLLDVRDGTIPELSQSFDRIAATLTNAVNQIHRSGFGLDGTTGLDFFTPLSVLTESASMNEGSGAIGSGAVLAPSLLTFHDYEVRFTSSAAYAIVDATTGTTIRGNYVGTAIAAPSATTPVSIITGSNDALTVTVDGVASGTITLAGAASPGLSYTSGDALALEIQTKVNADAALQAAGRAVSVVFDGTTGRFVLTSADSSASSAVNVTGGTAGSTLGLVSGTSTAATGTYASPMVLNFDGLSVTIAGTPAASDVFRADSYTDAAKNVAVALSSASSVAASSTRAGAPGNNTNALALVAVQHRQFTGLQSNTLDDAYRRTAAELGVKIQTAERNHDAQDILHDQIETIRAQVSGVSIDEEMINLMKYQRGFEAASRLIRVTDDMIETLLSLKR
jgi:flagellar hook-associated protein 1 FlgK